MLYSRGFPECSSHSSSFCSATESGGFWRFSEKLAGSHLPIDFKADSRSGCSDPGLVPAKQSHCNEKKNQVTLGGKIKIKWSFTVSIICKISDCNTINCVVLNGDDTFEGECLRQFSSLRMFVSLTIDSNIE